MNNGRICGTGAACEKDCPVMRIGRACPTVEDVFRECVEAGVNPLDVLTRLVPAPA